MKLFENTDTKQLDLKTIEYEPISSIDLMERAAQKCVNEIEKEISDKAQPILIFAGPGNNGGDALAIARILTNEGYNCTSYLIISGKLSPDCDTNRKRLLEITQIKYSLDLTKIPDNSVIIDGLFGSGLNKPIKGIFKDIVSTINRSKAKIISIDIPSGLFGEIHNPDSSGIVKADITLCLQFPKLSILYPENKSFIKDFKTIDINIHPQAIEETDTNYNFIEKQNIEIRKRNKHSHKGTYGHSLLIAGQHGQIGASVLAAKSCLRTGTGLLTVHTPECGYNIIQSTIPEAMVSTDQAKEHFSKVPKLRQYHAIGIGPGIGQSNQTANALKKLIQKADIPMLFDADALNIIAKNIDILKLIPIYSVITPHPKEFERLFGKTKNSHDRLLLQKEMSQKHSIIIVLKGHYTSTSTPEGNIYFNSTGNPGMATAGSGDVLTGIILSLLAQGYTASEAAIFGTYIHGHAGDIAANKLGEDSLIASDIIDNIAYAIKDIKNQDRLSPLKFPL